MLEGNFTFTSTIISPLSVGFLLFGIPRSGKVILWPGAVGPLPDTGTCLPSIVEIVLRQPVSASLSSSSTKTRRLLSSRLKTGCSFYTTNSVSRCPACIGHYDSLQLSELTSTMTKCRSCVPPSSWSPTPLNLIFVPALYPGLMSISRTFSSMFRLPVCAS